MATQLQDATSDGSRYEILNDNNTTALAIQVNLWVEAGWTALGAPVFVPTQPKPWFQAVVRSQA